MVSLKDSQFDRMAPGTWIFGGVMVILGAVGVYMMTTRPEDHPLLTVFFYSIPSNAGISLFPHEPVIVWYGKTVNLWLLSLVATAGTVVAAFLDYRFFAPVLNLSYSARYKATGTYRKAHRWFHKMPFISIVVAALTPIPFYPFKFMVYASKYPIRRYLSAVVIGRFPRYYLLGKAGQLFHIPDWLLIGSFLAMVLLISHKRIFHWLSLAFVLLYRLVRRRPLREEAKCPKPFQPR